MKIISLHYPLAAGELEAAEPTTIAIGHFDGVHRGHQNVIRTAVEAARDSGVKAAVMTFHPHPKEVLGQNAGPYATALTPLDDKLNCFERLGVDIVYVVQFDLAFAAVTPGMFVHDILLPLHVRRVVVGFDFAFGAKGAGNASVLRELCEPEAINVSVVEPYLLDGEKVSSTRIRAMLAEGKPQVAAELIGAPYAVRGTVVQGEGRGRTIGYPTANVQPGGAYVVPKTGVYAIQVEVDGKLYDAVLNIGVKPTFHDHLPEPVFEAHLFDFNESLYGKTVALRFIAFLRSERKFESIEALIAQINADAEEARSILSSI
ncbi:bifunctional riboflavin kinase/FAD synthetase [Paenibacillus aurantiacus]|uniref:Riboflavin biosynthesis protein n=1 Tax=Paenibacillus aurantiacus TaxID=1936118 RepID=A0ABV5KX03_9BACL